MLTQRPIMPVAGQTRVVNDFDIRPSQPDPFHNCEPVQRLTQVDVREEYLTQPWTLQVSQSTGRTLCHSHRIARIFQGLDCHVQNQLVVIKNQHVACRRSHHSEVWAQRGMPFLGCQVP